MKNERISEGIRKLAKDLAEIVCDDNYTDILNDTEMNKINELLTTLEARVLKKIGH